MAKLYKLPANAARNLRSEANQSAIRAGVIAFVALLVGGVIESGSAIIAAGLAIGGLCVAFVYGLSALRAYALVRNLPDETARVDAVGWTRAPDGSNYAIFTSGRDPRTDEPDLVLRLGSSKDTTTTKALLLGPLSPRRSAALIGPDGEVLAVGGLRRDENAKRVWARRADDTPWWAGRAKRTPAASPPAGRKRR